jgi:hypothetical protein
MNYDNDNKLLLLHRYLTLAMIITLVFGINKGHKDRRVYESSGIDMADCSPKDLL